MEFYVVGLLLWLWYFRRGVRAHNRRAAMAKLGCLPNHISGPYRR